MAWSVYLTSSLWSLPTITSCQCLDISDEQPPELSLAVPRFHAVIREIARFWREMDHLSGKSDQDLRNS
jgi:hypothetical protein